MVLDIGVDTQGADSHPSFLYAREDRWKSFERENYPSPPHWDRRVIQLNQIKSYTVGVPKWGRGGGVEGSQQMSTAVHIT
jgi:hypothetical protein